jgi:iron complex transport system substrate-binding protein
MSHSVSISSTDALEISVTGSEIPRAARVIALSNGSAEIIASMGLERILVGRDVASTMPALKRIPIVTSGHQVIPEKILSLKPDRVLVDASTGPKSAVDSLRSANISLSQIPEAWKLSDIAAKVTAIGDAIGAPLSAQTLNAKITSAISAAQLRTKTHPRIAFLYLRGTSAVYLMGGPGSGTDSLIAAIGGIDVGAATLKNPFNSLTSEALVTSRPDILLVMTKGLESVGGMSGLLSLPGVAQTPAGKFKRVIDVDDSLLLSFGPRTPALVGALAKAVTTVMHP